MQFQVEKAITKNFPTISTRMITYIGAEDDDEEDKSYNWPTDAVFTDNTSSSVRSNLDFQSLHHDHHDREGVGGGVNAWSLKTEIPYNIDTSKY